MTYDKDEAFQPIYQSLMRNISNPKWKVAFNRAKHKLGVATLDIPEIYELAKAVWHKPQNFPDLFKLINLK